MTDPSSATYVTDLEAHSARALFESDREAGVLDTSEDIEAQWSEWEEHYTRLAKVAITEMTRITFQPDPDGGWEELPPAGLTKLAYWIGERWFNLGAFLAKRRFERMKRREARDA